ncbi:uncharacterized protein TRIADDRAFT_51193 [Trichoplax adhaerens]|uniref:Uncharacterized protein n=1 Tax=Trichoplax adhaerens TaxID=10228 RepID=B3SDA5_TRIAD|nr:hypothetical protein TRIADDRAFT_51193 [Trichoplax adhaerens]EDV19309.1 hypothetical protein TRIADDRAFT_51193 [Trichoplax adhaerens]|eukprot:XP_002118233.1 hypothetical protein TRIADDRAFT_51193 [Trichoplax adhaerens]
MKSTPATISDPPWFSVTIWRYILSGTSCMTAGAITNPIDVIKIRLQLENELSESSRGMQMFKTRYYRGFLKGMLQIAKDEGFRGLCKGMFASVVREGSYSTLRIGSYEPLKVLMGARDVAHTPLWKKVVAGAVSGSMASLVTSPIDLVKVRQQAEGKLAFGQSKRHANAFAAVRDIIRQEGPRGLLTGMMPTVQRGGIVTAAQLSSYDHTKHTILNFGVMREGPVLHIVSSMVAGLVCAFFTSPVDVVKTRMMNQHKGEKIIYRSTLDCFVKTWRAERLAGFYKGFIPNWMRIGPHTVITFFIFEQLRRMVGIAPI